ncbi:MAG: transcriptional regulator, MarR family protein [Streptosporangiaceae bacterium]|nr:transcriptional regulator, MarR family protein [Streptosporangiaceae bacterium]
MPELLDLYGATSKVVRAATDLALGRHGLHVGQDHLLAQLWRQDGRTPGEIATAVGVSTPAVTNTATVLAKAGFLVRRPDEQDNRRVRLWLTEAGRALRPAVERERQTLEDALVERLTDAERRNLVSGLTKINRAATELSAKKPQRQDATQQSSRQHPSGRR